MKRSNSGWARIQVVLVLACVLVGATGSRADELQDAKALLRDGKFSDAMVQVNRFVERRPGDPSGLFVKGLIFSEQKRTAEAIGMFSTITSEHPEFPEPYNNLAVLLATSGQYAKARAALETALRLNPKYTTARENLGDVYLQSAMQAYAEVLEADGDNPGLRSKLRGLRSALGLPAAEGPAMPRGGTSWGGQPQAGLADKAGISDAAGQPGGAERARVLQIVDQWVHAWMAKDTFAYFSFYGRDFRTPNGESRERWERNRRARINRKEPIEITVLSPSVMIDRNTAVVNFQQVYQAGRISSNARKSLTLTNESGTWRIVQEKSEG